MRCIEIASVVALGALLAGGGTVRAEDAAPAAAPPAAEQGTTYTADQLDQMVSPIALYPDPLLAQVLMAATYPLELVQADRWMKKHAGLKGDALDQALESEEWDPSVKSMTHFPDVLGRMSQQLDWAQDLGDAFLGQQKEVMEAVQRMRAVAYKAGNLKSSKEQTVKVEEQGGSQTIIIQQADPQVIYVPAYSPTVVYGSAWAPPTYYYPAVMTYPPGYVATTNLLSFGVGMAVGAAVWGGCDWGNDHVTVNNYYGGGGKGGGNKNSNNTVNINKNVNQINKANVGNKVGNSQNWQHNPKHRGGVPYKEASAQKRYGDKAGGRANTMDSAAARGFDRPASTQQRPATGGGGSRPAGDRRGAGAGGPDRGVQQPARASGASRPDRPSQRPATSGSSGGGKRNDALGGYGNGKATREASARGAASRGGGGLGGSSGGGSRGKGGGGGGGGSRGGGGGGGGKRR